MIGSGPMVRFDGLPLHPLLVHAPVVLVPLVAAGLVLLMVRPSLRRHLGPIVAVLAIGSALTAIASVWSGNQLAEAMGYGDVVEQHRSWGQMTRTFASLVAVATVGFVASDRFLEERPAVSSALAIVATGLALASVAVVGLAGHAGATLAWQDRVPAEGEAGPDPGDATDDSAGGGAGDAGAGVPPTDDTPAPAPVAPLPGTGLPGVDVVLGEWAIVPSVVEAPPGQITFRFRNLGTVPHALRIRTQGSGGDRLEWRSELVGPGEVGLLVADLAAQAYDLDCPVEDAAGEHDQLGMELVFTVREGAPPLDPLPPGEAPATAPPGDDGSAGGDGEVAAGGATVAIRGFAFVPPDLRITAGTSVTWTNEDPAPHTATGDAFDTGRLGQGDAGTVTFSDGGTFAYLCEIHPAMRGTVIVEP